MFGMTGLTWIRAPLHPHILKGCKRDSALALSFDDSERSRKLTSPSPTQSQPLVMMLMRSIQIQGQSTFGYKLLENNSQGPLCLHALCASSKHRAAIPNPAWKHDSGLDGLIQPSSSYIIRYLLISECLGCGLSIYLPCVFYVSFRQLLEWPCQHISHGKVTLSASLWASHKDPGAAVDCGFHSCLEIQPCVRYKKTSAYPLVDLPCEIRALSPVVSTQDPEIQGTARLFLLLVTWKKSLVSLPHTPVLLPNLPCYCLKSWIPAKARRQGHLLPQSLQGGRQGTYAPRLDLCQQQGKLSGIWHPGERKKKEAAKHNLLICREKTNSFN